VVRLNNFTLSALKRLFDSQAIPQLNLRHETVADPQHAIGCGASLDADIALDARGRETHLPSCRQAGGGVVEADGTRDAVEVGL
jgi:hypothetical protein